MSIQWKCPKCGARANEHGKGGPDKCIGKSAAVAGSENCCGFLCDCDVDEEDWGSVGDPSAAHDHGSTLANVCHHAKCHHCGWIGSFPTLRKGTKLAPWEKKALEAGWKPPPDRDQELTMEFSKIAWTDGTFNIAWGCEKVSEGCKFCYAEAFSLDKHRVPLWGPGSERKTMSDGYWRQPVKWNKKAAAEGRRMRVFTSSMADVFEDHPALVAPRARLLRLIEDTPNIDWQVLTKRPENMVKFAAEAGWTGRWPDNVWAGTTVENQARADERIPVLLGVPARVRFLSCEPLLEPVTFTDIPCNVEPLDGDGYDDHFNALTGFGRDSQNSIDTSTLYPIVDWVIVGGESGPKARAFDLVWAARAADACQKTGTPFFMKQLGSKPLFDGVPYPGSTGKGDNPVQWPEELRIRQFPT